MADCSASGSTLDRAFSSLIGNHVGNEALERATKTVSSMVSEIAQKSIPSNIGENKASIHFPAPTETLIHYTGNNNLVSNSSMWHYSQQSSPSQYNIGAYTPRSMPYFNYSSEFQNRQAIMNKISAINQAISMTYTSPVHFENSINHSTYPVHTQVQKSESEKELFQENFTGSSHDVTMEELAAAWEDAEKEYLSSQDYDLSNIPSHFTNDGSLDSLSMSMIPYDFSEESRQYGPTHKQAVESYSNFNILDKGIELFHQGDISEAILCFESHLQTINPDDADAWLMLGRCHAENDDDRKAIACLERSVERNPKSSEALMALGVSCVNEFLHERALMHLKTWIKQHPQYSANITQAYSPESYSVRGSSETLALDELKNLLKAALDMDKSSDVPHSAEILEALGIVCNVTREYDDAANCFKAAIHFRKDDYQLWNKLGATLANSNHSDEALHAYRQALSLKPKYARAWLNMAIAHSNLQTHEEAARCYLQTLSLNPLATHVWNYLRISITAMERWDLMPLISSRDLQQFHSFFDFVEF